MGLGSEIRDPEKTYSGSRIPDRGVKRAPDPGSEPATLIRILIFIWCRSGSWFLFDAYADSDLGSQNGADPDPQHSTWSCLVELKLSFIILPRHSFICCEVRYVDFDVTTVRVPYGNRPGKQIVTGTVHIKPGLQIRIRKGSVFIGVARFGL